MGALVPPRVAPVAELTDKSLREHARDTHGIKLPRGLTRVELVGLHARDHRVNRPGHTHSWVPRPKDDDE